MNRTYALDARTATAHFPGIGRYARALAQHLPDYLAPGERLALLAPGPSAPENQLVAPESPEVALLLLDDTPFSLGQQWRLPRAVARLGASLYHSPYYLMPYRPGVPAVVSVFDLIPLQQPQATTARARMLFRFTMRLALGTAQRVIVPSRATQRALKAHYGVSPERLRVIPLAAGPRFQPQAPEEVAQVRRAFGISGDYVLYFGSNKPHKNLETLVQAWAQLQQGRPAGDEPIPLVVAGAWDPRFEAPRRLAQRLGVGSSIRFLGPVREADLPGLYSGAAVFVFPSLEEGFGLPVVEAMACGAPVVCSRAGSLPEVAGEACLYFDPTRAQDIAAALRRVLDDQRLRSTLGAKSLEQANRFSWAQTSQATLEIYREVLDAGRQ